MERGFMNRSMQYLFVVLTGMLILSIHVQATVLHVPADHATIQEAVNAASPGDTIQVATGAYTGPLIINKSLVLLGAGPGAASTIVAPLDFPTNSTYNDSLPHFVTERPIVLIRGTYVINVVFNGFTVDGLRLGPALSQNVSYSGILADRAIVTFTNDTVRNILPEDSVGSTWDSGYRFNGRAIEVRGDSSVATVSSNYFEQINRYHVLINATDTTTFTPAVFPTATVSNNVIVGKGVYNGAQKGIWFNTGAYGTISNNWISNIDYYQTSLEPDRASGIVIRFGYLNANQSSTIQYNTLTTSSSINNKGIYVQGNGDNITDNNVSGFRFGIEIHDGHSVLAARDTVTGGTMGFIVDDELGQRADSITIGGSPSNKNIITGQLPRSQGGFGISLSFRDSQGDNFLSTIPVNAQYNDFGVYSDSLVRAKIFDRKDTTLSPSNIDTVLYSPFYTPKLRASVKVFLQGPYVTAGDSMANNLKTSNTLSGHFSTPIPALAVDSINIELRNAAVGTSATIQKYSPAWLLTNGSIRNFSDTTKSYAEFDTTISGLYYIVVRHRNHLAIMSDSAQHIDGSTSPPVFDFSTGQNKAYGTNPMVAVGSRYAMPGGDGNQDGGVDALDRNNVWRPQNGSAGYLSGDFNLDGGVDALDRNNVWRPNNGSGTQVP